ncbi:PAS domain-containing sensor histidine kinase [Pseudoduganella umbonata]|uniref:histidine kinase n=1 Tax=Pseudoduganella umbonata TaxID=864828 RepID=A0A4P8HLP7_9BURK|nr:ATP-binding protein [Pseudoduganella umbonata]MBB3221678.1 PAS domain S-box-containing protein [Pseudoduganella umbonata]QCP09095.1 PAS domain S-box protein [Pseudoduganella umbonata]
MIQSAKLAERTRSETRLQALFEQAPVSIQILATDGRTLRVNRAWEDLWEIRAGTALMDYVLSAEYNVLTDAQVQAGGITPYLARAFAGESVQIPPIRYDVAVLGGAGPARWVSARAHPVKDGDGTVLEVMLMHEDITERIEAETALRIREERFRLLVMATSQIVWTNTPDGRVLEDSPSWRAFTGQTYEEWREFGWLDALHPDDRAGTIALWTRCVATQSVFDTRYRLRRADGQYRWMAVNGLPIADALGGIREWIGANTDIHDRVMAETELARRLEQEKRNSALLAKVAQASRILHTALSRKEIADALVVQVRDILQVHQAVVSLTEGDTWLQAINAVSLSDKYARYRDYAVNTDGTGIYAEVCRTNQVMRLTQAELTAHPAWKGFGSHAGSHPPMRGWLAVPLIDRTGRNIGLIQASDKTDGEFTVEDESILMQLASLAANSFENARLYCSLQEQDRRKDEFLAMLAHELRNPLAPISSAADMLRLGSASEERVRRASDVINRQVRHMTSLVDDLLDVSRVTRGLIELDREPVDVMAILTSAVEQSLPLIDARGHALAVNGAVPGAQVLGDYHRLVQVLVNLLNNAAKYTPRGGRITLTVARNGHTVDMVVADNGIGLDDDLLPHVFELFTQGKRSPDRTLGGLGIGLALVRNIVTMHGGTVSARSEGAGTGSTFTVTLDLIDGATPPR